MDILYGKEKWPRSVDDVMRIDCNHNGLAKLFGSIFLHAGCTRGSHH
jgi:hypothetical protein